MNSICCSNYYCETRVPMTEISLRYFCDLHCRCVKCKSPNGVKEYNNICEECYAEKTPVVEEEYKPVLIEVCSQKSCHTVVKNSGDKCNKHIRRCLHCGCSEIIPEHDNICDTHYKIMRKERVV